jgi:hypothetical protein
MEYKPLKTMNPSDIDLTVNSSNFFACRGLMPGKGNSKISVPHYIEGDGAMKTLDFSDVYLDSLNGIDDTGAIKIMTAASIVWRGLWAQDNIAGIGHCTSALGLVMPLNTFNSGYRYKRGWRPACVN